MGLGAYVVKNTEAAPGHGRRGHGLGSLHGPRRGRQARRPAACAGMRVVSMPSRELFFAQPKPIRDAILPPGARVVVAEAGVAQGWERIAKAEDILSIERFGESGPGDEVARHLGFTVDALGQAAFEGRARAGPALGRLCSACTIARYRVY